jgi:hypothetical protein
MLARFRSLLAGRKVQINITREPNVSRDTLCGAMNIEIHQ